MKKYLLVLVLVFACSLLYGQYKADFRAAEKYGSENLGKMIGSSSVQPNWLKKSDLFWYSYKTGDANLWWMVDPAKKTKSPLFDVYYMAAKINQMILKPVNHLDLPIKNLKFKDDNKSFNFEVDSFKFEYKLANKEVILVDTIEKEKKKITTYTICGGEKRITE
ncbi:MAG: hypothetical protein WC865_03965 [Bacteroidales bacterium]